jgi:hypothetical protein
VYPLQAQLESVHYLSNCLETVGKVTDQFSSEKNPMAETSAVQESMPHTVLPHLLRLRMLCRKSTPEILLMFPRSEWGERKDLEIHGRSKPGPEISAAAGILNCPVQPLMR